MVKQIIILLLSLFLFKCCMMQVRQVYDGKISIKKDWLKNKSVIQLKSLYKIVSENYDFEDAQIVFKREIRTPEKKPVSVRIKIIGDMNVNQLRKVYVIEIDDTPYVLSLTSISNSIGMAPGIRPPKNNNNLAKPPNTSSNSFIDFNKSASTNNRLFTGFTKAANTDNSLYTGLMKIAITSNISHSDLVQLANKGPGSFAEFMKVAKINNSSSPELMRIATACNVSYNDVVRLAHQGTSSFSDFVQLTTKSKGSFIDFTNQANTSNSAFVDFTKPANTINSAFIDFTKPQGTTKNSFIDSTKPANSTNNSWNNFMKQQGQLAGTAMPTNIYFHQTKTLVGELQITGEIEKEILKSTNVVIKLYSGWTPLSIRINGEKLLKIKEFLKAPGNNKEGRSKK